MSITSEIELKYHETFKLYHSMLFDKCSVITALNYLNTEYNEIASLHELLESIVDNGNNRFETITDVGSEFSLKTTYDPERLFKIHIGAGIYLDMAPREALLYISPKLEAIDKKIHEANGVLTKIEGSQMATKQLLSDLSFYLLRIECGFEEDSE